MSRGRSARPNGHRARHIDVGSWALDMLVSAEYRATVRRRLLRGRAGRLEEFLWQLALDKLRLAQEQAEQQQSGLYAYLTPEDQVTVSQIYRRGWARKDEAQRAGQRSP